MAKERIAVLYGGRSLEHEISIITALQAMQAIDSTKYEIIPVYIALNGKWYTGDPLFERACYAADPEENRFLTEVTLVPAASGGGFFTLASHEPIPIDVCLLAFHGQFGEDGSLQGLLELVDIPYTGCGVDASSLCMNKYACKMYVKAHDIAVVPGILVKKSDCIENFSHHRQCIQDSFCYPLFVKPNRLGSSIGIGKAASDEELAVCLAKVFQYDEQALVEPYVENLLELNIACLDGKPPLISPIEVPVASDKVLSYEDKYLRSGSKATGGQMLGMALLSRVIDPVDLDQSIKDLIEKTALKAFSLLGCSGICRFDFMHDLQTGKTFLNEVNTIPGSFAFYLMDKRRPKLYFTDLLERLFALAKERKKMQNTLAKDFGFSALFQNTNREVLR